MKIVGQLKAILGLDKSKFDKGLKDAEKKTGIFGKAMSKLGVVMAGVFAVGKIVDLGKQMITLAGQAQGVRQAFDRLNDPTLLGELQKATRGTVDDLKLMQYAVRADNFNIPLSKLATFFEFATKRATQTGESVDYLTESIINGIGRKSTLVMDNLGISAAELQAEVQRVGDFGVAAGNIIERGMAKMGDVTLTTTQKTAALGAAWTNVKTQIGEHLLPVVNKISEWGLRQMPKIIQVFDGFRNILVGVINYFIDLYNESTAVRAVVQGIGFVVKTAFAALKYEIKSLVEYFKIIGTVIKDAFTGRWGEIEGHVKQGLAKVQDHTDELTRATAQNWNKMMENMTKKPHVQLIQIKTTTKGAGAATATPSMSGGGEAEGGGGTKEAAAEIERATAITRAAIDNITPHFQLMDSHIQVLSQSMLDFSRITDSVFDGMASSIEAAFNSSEGILLGFGKFFTKFLGDMIKKMAAATAAAAILAAVMSLIPGMKAFFGFDQAATFGTIFKGMMKSNILGMNSGGSGVVGFNNNTSPAMLGAGGTAMTQAQAGRLNRSIDVNITGTILNRDITLSARRSQLDN